MEDVRGSCFFLRLKRSRISLADPTNSIPSRTTGFPEGLLSEEAAAEPGLVDPTLCKQTNQ